MADEDGRAGRSAAWGVLAGVFCAGCGIYVSQRDLPIWPTYLLGGLTVLALYLCFATIWGRWPTGRSVHGSANVIIEPSGSDSGAVGAEAHAVRADGEVPPASGLAAWTQRFSLALAVPHAFTDFLSGSLGLATSNDPPAQAGVWLESYRPLTAMVDIDGLHVLPGRSPSNQFIGWALADPDGKPAIGVARDWIVQLCEYNLHLDGFEQALTGESS